VGVDSTSTRIPRADPRCTMPLVQNTVLFVDRSVGWYAKESVNKRSFPCRSRFASGVGLAAFVLSPNRQQQQQRLD